MKTEVLRNGTLCVITLISVCIVLLQKPIAQSLSYHQFADKTFWMGLPHGANVWSNFPLIALGLAGIWQQLKTRIHFIWKPALVFFAGIMLTGFGSAWYHLDPDNSRLVWDRLPMTISFMGFFTLLCAVFISYRLSEWLLWPLCIAGVLAVLYWYRTEQMGSGDLRYYALIQFIPMLLTPLIVFGYPGHKFVKWYFACCVLVYLLAKLCEYYDREIYILLDGCCGHTLKHFLSGLVPAILLLFFRRWRKFLSARFEGIKYGNNLRDE